MKRALALRVAFAQSAVAAILMFFALPAGAMDLNSPAARMPTVQSEIERGVAAAGQCTIKRETADYAECIDGAVGRSSENPANGDAFRFGAYLTAWTFVDIDVRLDQIKVSSGLPPLQTKGPSALEWGDLEFRRMRALQSRLGISDAQLIDLTMKLMIGPTDLRERFAFYVQQSPSLN